MTVDAQLVTRKLLLTAGDIDQLRELHARGRNAYLVSRSEQAVAERLLERIVTRMIDVNYHLLTNLGYAPPSDYHASFERLGAAGVLDVAFASRVARAAGLRNRLVHDYDDLDQRLVFDAVSLALVDVPAYTAAVHAYVKRLTDGPATP